ncbi:MAG TPA: PAS domain-containing protein [Gammaproteobacteria bacterium]|nr:PAS domain-containing protein [Gammaproteobacteria bacterium]
MQKNRTGCNSNEVYDTSENWYRLRLFNYSRALLALVFITIYLNGWLQRLIGEKFSHPDLFIYISSAYLVAALLFTVGIYYRRPSLCKQVVFHTLVDITCIVLLVHTTGGVSGGLGMLLIITISMTSLFLPKRLTLLFAAISALAIIGEQVYAEFTYLDYKPSFTQAGLLGILIFISAYLSTYTARRLKESEKLAAETSHELESIVQMNDHIIQSMRTGIIVVHNSGQIIMANNAAMELLGKKQINAHSYLQDIAPDLYQRFADWLNNTVQNHRPLQQAQGLPDLQPGFSEIDHNLPANKRLNGRSLIFLEDATQLAQRFQQIKLASLGRLTASIAHEIRNPLAAINHAGQLLGESSENAADRKLTGIINTQVKRLNGIVENVLQLSRQQKGNAEAIRLLAWLQNFRDEFIANYQLQAYQIQIRVIPEDMEILFDNDQLHQVMWNLCSNAINHSHMEHNNIMISIQAETDPDLQQPCMNIIDNGAGIDEETRSHIFDPFFTTSSDGTGLGLYITKEVIESNRAKIRYIPPPGGGSCFRICFLSPLKH